MNTRMTSRAAVLSAATLAVMRASPTLLAHGGPTGAASESDMHQQMEQVQAARRAMHEAPAERRDQAMAEHRHDMRHMMDMMRAMRGPGGMSGMSGMSGMDGQGGMGPGKGRMPMDGAGGPGDMGDMSKRMARMEDMMSEMLEHMDMHERAHAGR